eukprot:SAG31_NODE_935_length_10892_cov_7.109886_8_plen_164_part_00
MDASLGTHRAMAARRRSVLAETRAPELSPSDTRVAELTPHDAHVDARCSRKPKAGENGKGANWSRHTPSYPRYYVRNAVPADPGITEQHYGDDVPSAWYRRHGWLGQGNYGEEQCTVEVLCAATAPPGRATRLENSELEQTKAVHRQLLKRDIGTKFIIPYYG